MNMESNFAKKELELKKKYYQSNPLRNYAPTRGQLIIPEKLEPLKRPLPSIFNELRISKDIEEDRYIHAQKLKTSLNINLKFLDPTKNQIDQIESSKKIYSEYCKLNLNKPLDLTQVESVLKKQNLIYKRSDFGSDSDMDSSLGLFSNKTKSDLKIDAQMVDIKYLDDLNIEIKEHKKKLAKLNDRDEELKNNKYRYRILKSGSNFASSSSMPQPHKGSIYNYRQSKRINTRSRLSSAPSQPSSIELNDDLFEDLDYKKNHTKLNSNSLVDNREMLNQYQTSMLRDYEYIKRVLYTEALSNEEKHRIRISKARDKILNEHYQRHNLNKMTILQPFEDTKILINIDQVPPRFLKKLLNKEHIAPRYYIPPIRAYGYFKKVISEPNNKTTSSLSSIGHINKKKEQIAQSQAELQAEKHNFSLDSLKTLNESQSTFVLNKDNSILSNNNFNNNTTSSLNNFDLKVDIVKKDVSIK